MTDESRVQKIPGPDHMITREPFPSRVVVTSGSSSSPRLTAP